MINSVGLALAALFFAIPALFTLMGTSQFYEAVAFFILFVLLEVLFIGAALFFSGMFRRK